MDTPEVRHVWNGDVALAYQVFGDGPVDLLYLQGYRSHLDLAWRVHTSPDPSPVSVPEQE